MHEPQLYARVWDVVGQSISGVYPIYSGRVYYQVAPASTDFPVLVYQSVVNQAYVYNMLNDSYWSALITFRSIGPNFADCQNRLAQSLVELSEMRHITLSGLSQNYTVRFDVKETPSFPVEKLSESYIYTAAVTVEAVIFPT